MTIGCLSEAVLTSAMSINQKQKKMRGLDRAAYTRNVPSFLVSSRTIAIRIGLKYQYLPPIT